MTSTSIRSEKVAVVSEVREKLAASDAAIVTEYRGMTVAALAQLRRELRKSGAEYKVYKNTLARFAAREAGYEGLESMLVGSPSMSCASNSPVPGPVEKPMCWWPSASQTPG